MVGREGARIEELMSVPNCHKELATSSLVNKEMVKLGKQGSNQMGSSRKPSVFI